jgi:hypothetical protein
MRDDFLDSLAPPDPHWLTGAVRREAKPQDWGLQNVPQVAEVLAEGVPDSFSCLDDNELAVEYVQIGGSCVPTSLSVVQSCNDWKDGLRWRTYDAQEMYKAQGGTGSNGVATDGVLSRMKSLGLQEVGSDRRAKIAGYAFAPRVQDGWRRTLAAAMVSSGPVVVATLLPQQFGWDSSGPLTSGYHQMCATRYEGLHDDGLVIFPNTWGRSAGRNGFFRLSWRQLEQDNFQDGYTYGYQVVDLDDLEPPEPVPDPGARPVITLVKRKKLKNKYLVWVQDASPDARLFIDGEPTDVGFDDGRFVLRRQFEPGQHTAVVVNGNGKDSPPYLFQVTE